MKKKTPPVKTVRRHIGLARVSSREQQRVGFSLATQEEIRRHIERAGGEVVRIWSITETASEATERRVFQEILDYARDHAHLLSGFVVSKIDRAARNIFDYTELERLQREHGVPLLVVNQHFSDDPAGRLSRRMMANMAAFVTEQMSEDIKKGQARRAASGLTLGRAPFGYQNVRRDGRSAVEVLTCPRSWIQIGC